MSLRREMKGFLGWFSLLFLLCFFSAPSLSFCDGAQQNKVDPDVREAARVSFKKGVGYFNEGDYEQSLEYFLKSNDILFNWKMLYNIGQCYAILKKYDLALESFEKYLAEGGDSIPRERQDEVMTEMTRLKQLVAEITIEAPGRAEIIVDGQSRGKVSLIPLLRIVAGVEHEVIVRLDGEDAVKRKLKLGSGQSYILSIPQAASEDDKEAVVQAFPEDLTPSMAVREDVVETSPEAWDEGRKKLSAKPFIISASVTVGLGLAFGVADLTLGRRYKRAKDETQEKGLDQRNDDGALYIPSDEYDAYMGHKAAAIALFSATMAGVLTTAVLSFFTDFSTLRSDEENSESTEGMIVSPMWSGGRSGGLLLRKSF